MYYTTVREGRDILFLHGWGCDGSVFLPVANRLSGYRSILPDLNGFGKTPPPPCAWDVRNYAEATAEMLRGMGVNNTLVVAHSFGARVALALAALYPVEGMLLVAPAALKLFSFRRVCKVAVYKGKKLLKKLGFRVTLPKGSADYAACSPQMRPTFLRVVNGNVRPLLKKVSCPVVIINGRQDCETTVRHAKALKRRLKNCTLTLTEGGHFAFFAGPQSAAFAVRCFAEGIK